jgi:flagellar protein FlbD
MRRRGVSARELREENEVIYVTRLDGSQLAVNADLIETVEHTADTVITLVHGKRLIVSTPVDEIVARVTMYRQQTGRCGMPSLVRPLPASSSSTETD